MPDHTESNNEHEPINIQSEWIAEYLEEQRAERQAAEEAFRNSPFAALLNSIFPDIDQYSQPGHELSDEEFAEFAAYMKNQRPAEDNNSPENPS